MAINGKVVGMGIITITTVFAAGVYYAQVYGYYDSVPLDAGTVELTPYTSDTPEEILFTNFRGIDADSSPIRYRACFETDLSPSFLSESYQTFERAEPRNAPDWFDCFNAAQIGEDLETGTAIALLGQKNFEYGVDRVVAVYPDGRGFVWHQLNDCGDKLYDGSPASDDCPEKE